MNIDIAIQREFGHGYLFQAAYVAALAHNITRTICHATNLTIRIRRRTSSMSSWPS